MINGYRPLFYPSLQHLTTNCDQDYHSFIEACSTIDDHAAANVNVSLTLYKFHLTVLAKDTLGWVGLILQPA